MSSGRFARVVTNNKETIEDTNTVLGNGININNDIKAAEGLANQNTITTEKLLNTTGAAHAGASTALGAVETAGVVAKSGGQSPAAFTRAAPHLARIGSRIGVTGVILDTTTLAYDIYEPERKAKVANVLGGISGALGVAAAGATGTIVGAPAGAVLIVLSGGFAGASIAVGDLTVNEAADKTVEAMRSIEQGVTSAIESGLDKMGNTAINLGLGIKDSLDSLGTTLEEMLEELPEISGSQQNQLMAISKGPSFNYTSHKKDSVAGYTLYQMLDNAEDTISSSFMNGFTVYVMGKTIQPTCQGDESGIGGGVKSGTVGKEVRATSGAPSIFYCGYMSIRADDTCTMNNENVEGKYISLC